MSFRRLSKVFTYWISYIFQFRLYIRKKSAKNRESQWHAQSAHLAQTGHENVKYGFCGRFQGGPSIHIWP